MSSLCNVTDASLVTYQAVQCFLTIQYVNLDVSKQGSFNVTSMHCRCFPGLRLFLSLSSAILVCRLFGSIRSCQWHIVAILLCLAFYDRSGRRLLLAPLYGLPTHWFPCSGLGVQRLPSESSILSRTLRFCCMIHVTKQPDTSECFGPSHRRFQFYHLEWARRWLSRPPELSLVRRRLLAP